MRYAFLDGLRGLAALYVVLNHIWARFVLSPSALPPWFHLLKFGHAAVGVFIVLSGFCLMLPVTRRSEYALVGGLSGFLARRARRILPAYYAALGLSLLLAHLRESPELTAGNVLAHLLLLHNWVPHFSIAFNGPLWSVALEWQIYFVFALVLLPVRRRWGRAALLLVALGLSVAAIALGYGPANPWFVLLFALGMLGAEVALEPQAPLKKKHALGLLALTLATACIHLFVWRDHFPWPTNPTASHAATIALDVLLALTTLVWLVVGSQKELPTRLIPLFRGLSSRPLVALGGFSYSLYLMHDPILSIALRYLKPWIDTAPVPTFFVVLVSLVPAVLGLCYLFHRVFERPFLRRL